MQTDDPGGRSRESLAADPQARAEAAELLADVLDWRLPANRWAEVGQLVSVLAAASAEDSAVALREAMMELELAGPVRVTRIGAADEAQQGPPPEPVRERVNRLIYALGTEPWRPGSSRG
jgi:hypothetical protein